MANEFFPKSGIPIRKTVDLLPQVFKTKTNEKFLAGVLDPMVQPGTLEKTVGYIGKRFGKTYKGSDIYLDSDNSLRSRYQLEPGVVLSDKTGKVENFYDYVDFKNQLKFFNNLNDRDDLITSQEHYTWNPPIEWDKFVNFREYYWVPNGPPSVKVLGQGNAIVSTYKVRQGTTSSWLITPDGLTNNPTITLYRGQIYKFNVNSPREGFYIRTAIDTGSLNFNPALSYITNQLVIFDGKLWRAKRPISPKDGSSIDENSEDWELVDTDVKTSKFDYDAGVTNNGTTNGTVIFEVPLDAPDVLYYQSSLNVDRFGRFLIQDIEENTSINVEKEIIGKQTYTSSNGVEFSNGLIVRFGGRVTPSKYAKDNWLVEKVGREITLIKFSDLEVPVITSQIPEVIFDNGGFDTEPFDDATSYPGEKDYITICRASIDNNPWSRYNRWFHRSTLEYAHRLNGTDFEAGDNFRAKRPIIEFRPNLQLFNHGSIAKKSVDFIDTFTTDIFSTIEGSQGYSVDGEFLYQGARVLFTADTDTLANNRIYQVNFITHNNVRQITLKSVDDAESNFGECVLVRSGKLNKGLMYHFNGTNWVQSQRKLKANQLPLFDIFDENGVSFGDTNTYSSSTFTGSPILSYKVGNSIADNELGFSLDYLNIDNVGDILFNFNLDQDTFNYSVNQQTISVNLNTGYFRFNPFDDFQNGWVVADPQYMQPILDSTVVTEESTNTIILDTIDWSVFNQEESKIIFYLNGIKLDSAYTREKNTFTFEKTFVKNDAVSIKIYTTQIPDRGYYQIPHGLEKNPLNQNLTNFTLGQAVDHLVSAIEVNSDFIGSYPGSSNLRDIDGYQTRCTRFLKHSGIAPMAVSLLCDKNINVVKALQYSLRNYTSFKNEFIKRISEKYPATTISDLVDEVISEMGASKDNTHPFVDSDMIGSGAYKDIVYEVEDEGIKVFALTEKFSLNELSRRAVYLYRNEEQFLYGRDYVFDETFGFVRITASLNEGDKILIREYVSTAFNYIPPTPTKLGLYKKYTPRIFLDDTYAEPRMVIQGHDGSITTAFDDYRDNALLELEKRIYNNIKQNYNEKLFDIDRVFGGYYGNALYDKSDIDSIIAQDFLKWVSNSDIDFTNSSIYYQELNTFTYTYSNMTDPTGTRNLPGYWRGVYQWFYDTVRPHQCPWEMLGFSEKPDWWESEYGPAPYTKNNLILWEDLESGIIRRGPRAGTYDRYARPGLVNHIPTDGDGKLLSPLDSGIATNYTLINNRGDYKVGDVSPAEYAWRSSSEYPYSILIALCLLKPFEFITDSFDKSRMTVNRIGQTVSKETGIFIKLENMKVPELGGLQLSGLVSFVTCYIKSKNLDPTVLIEKLNNLDVKISTRLSGFIDQTEQKYLLDSKNPSSTSSSIYIPNENYNVIFNISVPYYNISYSGVLIEKFAEGWKVRGYDPQQPYFNYFKPIASSVDPVISVGGVSADFLDWASDKLYGNGDIVRYQNAFFRAIKSHTSGVEFDKSLWKSLPKLPVVGGVDAAFRRTFNNLKTNQMLYGTVIRTVQGVVDFLLGYQAYLKTQGLSFDRYDAENQVAYNWQTSCKEFLFWTKHNWPVGSLLTLSPSAGQVDISIPNGVADNMFDSFYDYQIFKSDGTPLLPIFLNVNREFQKCTVSTVNTNDGIYFLKVYFVLKEHVTLFDDRTVFNDVIYDKTTGYRQERIKSRGFRTVDWDGDYTSPGFLFDNVDIKQWQPYTDYRLGDIVSYKSFNWVSLVNQQGSEFFDNNNWEKLDSTPTKGLVPNFDYRINQFEDYYDVDADGLGSSQRDLSRHVIGYQTREYLQNIAEDNVSQFKIYQGFIKEKGTSNAITKVFDKLSRTDSGSIVLNEEWAFRVGRLGGLEQSKEYEFRIYKNDFKTNPQPIVVTNTSSSTDELDLYLRVKEKDFTIAPIPFTTEINPTKDYDFTPRTAGYVNGLDVDFAVRTRDDILSLSNLDFEENNHVWISFDGFSWTVLRYNTSRLLYVTDLNVNKQRVEITVSRAHELLVGDIFGIRGIENLVGFYKITEIPDRKTLVIQISKEAKEPKWDNSSLVNLELFTEARFTSFENVNPETTAKLTTGAKLWIDRNENNKWEVVSKQQRFSYQTIADYGITAPLGNGTAIVYIENLTQVVSSMPASNLVVSYVERTDGLKPFQNFDRPNNISSAVNGVFGESLAVSPDGRWLVIGSPRATAVKSDYRETFNPSQSYSQGDIVLYKGKLWRAKRDLSPDGSTLSINSDDWDSTRIIAANDQGSNLGYKEQGVITIYEWTGQNWVDRYSFVSPRQDTGELYGHKICLGMNNGNYYMAVSAPGALSGKGRVYLYKYAPLLSDQTQAITFKVTVANPQGIDTGPKFYINEAYRPNITLEVGNTYIFDQSDLSNVYYPNPTTGTITNRHPLMFSSDNANGVLGGGSLYSFNISYQLDNRNVTQSQYLAGFDVATTRKVIINVTEGTAGLLYYYSTRTLNMGNSLIRKYPNIAREWQFFDNQNYRGVYDASGSTLYEAGDIIWYDNNYWESLETQIGDGSTVNITSNSWTKLDPISTQNSLPTNIALEDDGSTMAEGMLNTEQLAELVKIGDKFGTSMTMNRDGSILVVGTPYSDGQYFQNYRGVWTSYQEYTQGDVVKYENDSSADGYYQLGSRSGVDSTYRSYNENPSSAAPGNPWTLIGGIGDEEETNLGDVIIGRRYTITSLGNATNSNWETAGFPQPTPNTITVTLNAAQLILGHDRPHTIVELGNTDWNLVAATTNTPITSLVAGQRYRISSSGTSDWTSVGSSSNLVDYEFVATGSGTGSGTANRVYAAGDNITVVNPGTGTGKARTTKDADYDWPIGHPLYGQKLSDYKPAVGRTFIAKAKVGGTTAKVKLSTAVTGKVFVYKLNDYGFYSLIQTITADSLPDYSDLPMIETINPGDQFGYALDLDNSGSTLVISSPLADMKLQNQGSVYVFKLDIDSSVQQFRAKQKLQSFEIYNNELFGSSVSISERQERIVVGAKNTPYRLPTRFDGGRRTRFDGGRTTFSDNQGYPGQVYVYELKGNTYLLAEKLEAELGDNESFGNTLDTTASVIVTGSPEYKSGSTKVGMTRIFKKDVNKNSLEIIGLEEHLVNLDLLKSISLYDDENAVKISDIDIIDPNKLKIIGAAEQEIKYKTPYDPATYTNGTDQVVVDEDQAWFEKNLGSLWWDLSTVKWVNYEQSDIAYRTGNWNQLALGASVDVYEWVESTLSPVDYAKIADTTEGIAAGISGQPAYNNQVYSYRKLLNPATGLVSGSRYYFWVKNKTIVPVGVPGRRTSASIVKSLIENPASQGTPILAIMGPDKFLAYNFYDAIKGNSALINIEYYNSLSNLNQIHNEYQLLTEGVADSLPSFTLERKWIDSLVGFNEAGNPCPDPTLLPKQRYGLSFRPIQTMFVDRAMALKIVIDRINSILITKPFSDLIDFVNLETIDPLPSETLNLYDVTIDTFDELAEVGIVRIRPAVFSANIVDGEIDTIDIVDSGFGYRNPPPVTITGDGTGAKASVEIDNQGRIKSITILEGGRKYTNADVTVRNFSVLVKSDRTFNGYWSIYFWDNVREGFFKTKVQAYDTKRYWDYADWYANGYSSTTRIVKEIVGVYDEPKAKTKVGDIIRVTEFANGGWALLERVKDGQGEILENYTLVARKNGTIQISKEIYNVKVYDYQATYDEQVYDNQPTQELRYIFKAVKENIFIDDLTVEWNKLFFASIRYIFSEQKYVDWAFKTSFLNAIHNVGDLAQKTSYKNDNLESFQQYLEEVKPFRTTIREYTSRYTDIDNTNTYTTDFDCPPAYDIQEGRIMPVLENSEVNNNYPWKSWKDNIGYGITTIELSYEGSDYKTPPKVLITGDGTGAEAQAYISNGVVSGIKVLKQGQGYTYARASLVGGNGTSQNIAKASPILGSGNVRSFGLGIKFDRITKDGLTGNFTYTQTFVADGFTAVFDLNYPPTRDKTKIAVEINSEIILDSDYSITFYKSSADAYELLRGKLKLNNLPVSGDVIVITYEKNDEILDSVDRINKYYSPTSGMIGKEINQLMTGIDFGGVQIQGTTFDVSGGWDALPWFTDTWDSVEANADFYYVVDTSNLTDSSKIYSAGAVVKYLGKLYRCLQKNINLQGDVIIPLVEGYESYWTELEIELPFTPAIGQAISIYYKSFGSTTPRSIDTLDSAGAPIVVYDEGTDAPQTRRIDNEHYLSYTPDGSTDNVENWNRTTLYHPNTIVRFRGELYTVIKDVYGVEPRPNSLIPTFIGDGSTKSIGIQNYISINDGDTLIFRPLDSDGTVNITDVNIIDTNLSGGSLSSIEGAYSTATGTLAEDIVVDGGKYISPDYVPAPEEQVPGQVLESVSIKVFHSSQTGTTPLQSKIVKANGATLRFGIGQQILESSSVLVYVDKIKYYLLSADSTIKYTIDYVTNEIEFATPPANGSIVEILSIGIGGAALLDYQEFEADGDTLLFLTRANYFDTASVVVTVDGEEIDTEFINSSDLLDVKGRTLVQFTNKPARRQIVKIVCLGAVYDADSSGQSVVRVNEQIITYDGSTMSYDLDRFVNLSRASAAGSALVEINGIQIVGVETSFFVYNGQNNVIQIQRDPVEFPNTATQENIKVYVNNLPIRYILDWNFDGNSNTITVSTDVLNLWDEVKIVIDLRSEFDFENNNLVLKTTTFTTPTGTITLNLGDEIKITWFSEYPSMNIISDQYAGGKVQYQLARQPVSASYVWVYVNGARLTQDIDFEVSVPRNIVILKSNTVISDKIKIVQFGNYIRRPSVAFEIFKDMLNVYHFKRFARSKKVTLAQELYYYDQTIVVTDASELFEPIKERNLPGTIWINGERIDYFTKIGNVLGQLRRGCYGSSIKEYSPVGTELADISYSENLPYSESQLRSDFISDGSSLLIGPLDFIPAASIRQEWYRSTIPQDYRPCDQIEVFAAGKRLRKDPVTVYDSTKNITSPQADITLEAEFSVEGSTPYIRLTSAVPAGTRITVIRRQGKTWYDRGLTTATTGQTMLKNTSPVPSFIKQKPTELPE